MKVGIKCFYKVTEFFCPSAHDNESVFAAIYDVVCALCKLYRLGIMFECTYSKSFVIFTKAICHTHARSLFCVLLFMICFA